MKISADEVLLAANWIAGVFGLMAAGTLSLKSMWISALVGVISLIFIKEIIRFHEVKAFSEGVVSGFRKGRGYDEM